VATARLQLVEEVVQRRDALFQTLAFSGVVDDSGRLGGLVERITGQYLPVIKDTLWECLSTSVRAQISSKTYTTSNRKVHQLN